MYCEMLDVLTTTIGDNWLEESVREDKKWDLPEHGDYIAVINIIMNRQCPV